MQRLCTCTRKEDVDDHDDDDSDGDDSDGDQDCDETPGVERS